MHTKQRSAYFSRSLSISSHQHAFPRMASNFAPLRWAPMIPVWTWRQQNSFQLIIEWAFPSGTTGIPRALRSARLVPAVFPVIHLPPAETCLSPPFSSGTFGLLTSTCRRFSVTWTSRSAGPLQPRALSLILLSAPQLFFPSLEVFI